MIDNRTRCDEIKRRIRVLKKQECRIRFGKNGLSGQTLVWDEFFDLHVPDTKKAKYTLNRLAAMNPDQLTDVIGEYFWSVFYRFYQENGLGNSPIYDPGILVQMGLPCDADSTAIKKRFRALAKQVHPDTGGDSDRFIELINNYRKLTERE